MPKPVSFPFPIRNPLPPNSAFGKRPLYGDFHTGVDFNSTTGAYLNTPVRAAGPGKVIASYNGNEPGQSNWAQLRGTMVVIDHYDGWLTRYHMLVPNSNIPFSTLVNTGDIIGKVGSSGRSTTGPHLHFELWLNGVPIDPVPHLSYKPAALAGSGSTPIDNEEEMKPDERNWLESVYKAVFFGGGDAGPESVMKRLADIETIVGTTAPKVDDVQKALSTELPKIDNLNRQLTGAEGQNPSAVSRIIDLQNSVAGLSEDKPVEIDYEKLAASIAANFPATPLTKEDIVDALKSVTLRAE